MNCEHVTLGNVRLDLNMIFAVELFSKLSEDQQKAIVSQIKDLLLHG